MTPLDPEALEEDAGAPAPDVDLQQPACGHPRAVSIEMVVDPHLGGARADQFLSQRIRRLSRTRAAEIVARGDVQRPSGRVLRPSTRVVAGETLVLFRVPPDDEPPTLTLHLVHQDEQLLVLDKPPNMAVHPSARYYASTLTQLLLRRGYPVSTAPDAVRVPHPVHRLDRETSGVLVCARTASTEKRWKDAFFKSRVKKTYLALCQGTPTFTHTVLDMPLGLQDGLPVRIKMGPHPQGQPAQTDVEVLWQGAGRCLVACRPLTGRTHQIRAHLSAVGLPILGDKLYGPQGDAWFARYADGGLTDELRGALAHERQALHAAVLEGEGLTLLSRWPDDLRGLHPEAAPAADVLLASRAGGTALQPSVWTARVAGG